MMIVFPTEISGRWLFNHQSSKSACGWLRITFSHLAKFLGANDNNNMQLIIVIRIEKTQRPRLRVYFVYCSVERPRWFIVMRTHQTKVYQYQERPNYPQILKEAIMQCWLTNIQWLIEAFINSPSNHHASESLYLHIPKYIFNYNVSSVATCNICTHSKTNQTSTTCMTNHDQSIYVRTFATLPI